MIFQSLKRGLSSLGISSALAFALCLNLQAQSPATEYQVKAAYLLNFGKFVTWPASTVAVNPEPFSICVLGEDPFGSVLDSTVRGEKIDGRSVVAKRIRDAGEASACNILFISRSEQGQVRKIASSLGKSGVLTVSDSQDFINRGGAIQFTLSGNRVRFEVSLDAAREAGLGLSSELLKVASSVHGKAKGAEQ
jgi:hypothetical protein